MKTNKIKYFSLIVVVILSFFSSGSALALVNNSFQTFLGLVNESINDENGFIVNINISAGFKLKGLSANLIYDDSLVEIEDMSCHDKFSCTLGDGGEVVASSVKGVDGEYVLMTLAFKILDDNYEESANDIVVRLGNVKGAYDTITNSSELVVFKAEKQEHDFVDDSNSEGATVPNTGSSMKEDFSGSVPLLYFVSVICIFGLTIIMKKVIRRK